MKSHKVSMLLVAATLILYSCNPKVSTSISKDYSSLNYDEEVIVLGQEDATPVDGEYIGEVKIGDTGFTTNCTYVMVLESLKLEARRIGGNLAKITAHKSPGMGSSCHRITASVYKVDNIKALIQEIEVKESEGLDPNIDYATLYVYRPGAYGFLVGYNLHLDDRVLCRVKSNFKEEIKVYETGPHTLWAKTEAKSEVQVDLKPGKKYYVRCELGYGFFVGHPKISIVGEEEGRTAYNNFKAKKR